MQNRRHTVNSTTEKALAYIRDAILSGKLPAGSLLPTKNLAEEIGVSRTPVRDALRQLETEGLVTIAPRQEARVKELMLEEDEAIGELRIALAAYAAQLAALHRTEEDLEEIRVHQMAFAELANRPLPVTEQEDEAMIHALNKADEQFHVAILSASRNGQVKAEALRFMLIQSLARLPRTARTLRAIPGDLSGCRPLPAEVAAAHEKILHAIEIQSAAGAYAEMCDYLQENLKRRLRALKAVRDQEMQQALGHPLLS